MNPTSNSPSSSSFSLFLVNPSTDGFLPYFDFDFFPVDKDAYADADAGISQWELVNPSDSDELSDFEFDCYDDHGVATGPSVAVEFAPPAEDSSAGKSPPLIDPYICGDAFPDPSVEAEITDFTVAGNVAAAGDGYEYRNEYDYDDDDEEEEEEEYDDGLDDELVPRHMRGKLGRERIRKLGKRGCSKMNSSKKSPSLYVKRGCLHGKHGFGIGLKNSL